MAALHEHYLVDEEGNRTAVVLPLAAWRQILEDLEELDDIRAYDAAKARPSEPVSFEQAMREVQRVRSIDLLALLSMGGPGG